MTDTTINTGLTNYIQVALAHQDIMKKYEQGGPMTYRFVKQVEASMDQHCAAIDKIHGYPLSEIREAERKAGIEEKYQAYS